MNVNDSERVLFDIEFHIRNLINYYSKGWCSAFIIYDCCRSDSHDIRNLVEMSKSKGFDQFQQRNIYSVYGTIAGETHPAASTLARDLLDMMVKKASLNKGFITFPWVFDDYCG